MNPDDAEDNDDGDDKHDNDPGDGDRDADYYADADFVITSDDGHVALATVTCAGCSGTFEAVTIFCRSGTAFGEPLENFTVANITRVDAKLATSLSAWPQFRPCTSERLDEFANHCPHCGTVYEDHLLHDEPEAPFFDIAHAVTDRVKLSPIHVPIQLSGDEHYQVD